MGRRSGWRTPHFAGTPLHNPFAFDGRQQARLGQHRARRRMHGLDAESWCGEDCPHDRRPRVMIRFTPSASDLVNVG
jgi:hypothetical protein